MGMGISPSEYLNLQTPAPGDLNSPAPSLESIPTRPARSPPAHPLSPQGNTTPQPDPSTARVSITTPPVLTGIIGVARSAITGSWLVPGLVDVRTRLRWLFLRAVLQLKEAPGYTDTNRAWDTLENSLVLTSLFSSPEDVRSAWHFAFQELPVSHFISLFQKDVAEIRRLILEIAASE